MHFIFHYFTEEELSENYDDVVTVQQFFDVQTGVDFKIYLSKLELFSSCFLQIIVAKTIVRVINVSHIYIRACSGGV